MQFASKLFSAVLMTQSALVFAKGNTDTIFYGGPVVTVNAKNEEAQALAVQNGKIVAVGTKEVVTKDWQASTAKKVVDLQGQTLMSGFVEPHVHIIITSVSEGLGLKFRNFTLPYDTKETWIQKMKAALKNIPAGG
ncbi:hypothetical protein [Polynucleobacter necessarius]|uniref:hypothetical protein n=1 Tax=Polynucleobacter necessarius TaxID=576610 RepID=UPI000E08E7D1|nr:hypothetical protein [Polynucleobacter necessarius]HAT39665.1 hypothetical protein [Polynucleobacter sp.]